MNRIYKTVWNEALAAWVAVQETAKSHGKSASSGTGGGNTVVLDRLGMKKAQRFVPAVMVSALALAAGQANAGTGFYLNDGQDINCTGIADSTGAVQYAIMGSTIHTPFQGTPGVLVPNSSFFGITSAYNPCKPVNGNREENRDTQTNRTLFYGSVNGPANTTDNGAKNLTLGGRLDVNSGIIGVGYRGTNGVDPSFTQNGYYKDTNGNLYRSSNSIRMGTGLTLDEANNKEASIAIGVDTKSSALRTVAIGWDAQATGNEDVAYGVHAKASGGQAVALGPSTQAIGSQSTSIGNNSIARGNSSVSIGGDDLNAVASTTPLVSTNPANNNDALNDTAAAATYRNMTGQNLVDFTSTAGRYIPTEAGDGAVALGVQAKATGALSTAFGTKTSATGVASVALGVGASADKANAVALGAGSTTAATATSEKTATVGSITYGSVANPFAGSANVTAGDQVSIGSAGFERQIKHVAPGAINAASTDAINGSQLYATQAVIGNVAGSMKNILGGNAAVGADGKLSMNNIGGTGKGNIHDAIQASRTTVSSNNGSLTVTKTTNGTTGADNYDLSVNAQSLAESAQLPVVYTKADGSKVYKHTDGNFYDAPNGAGNQVPVGDVIASMQNAAGSTTTPTTLANVKAGVKPTDAVNVSQLKGAADALGGGAGIADGSDPAVPAGTFIKPSYTITKTDGTTYAPATNVGDALSNLNAEVIKPLTFAGDSGSNVQRKLGSTLNVKGGATGALTEGNIGVVADATTNTLNLKLAQNIDLGNNGSVKTGATKMDNNGITIAAPTPTDPANKVSLTSGGLNNGGNKISNVADGTAPNDAVNLSQLQAMGKAAKTHYYSVNSSEQAAGSNYNNDGATGTDALAAGVKAKAAQRNSVAIGNEAEVVNSPANPSSSSIAIGDKAKAQGDLALAIGPGATVSGENAAGGIAIGSAATSNNGGMAVGSGANAGNGTPMIPGLPVRLNNNVALGDSALVKDDTNFRVALGSFSIAGESDLTAAPYKPTANANVAGVAGPGVELGEVSVGGDNTAGMGKTLYRRITNVAAGAADTDAVNVSQLKAASNKVTAGDGITVTDIANTDGSTTYKVAADTTPLAVGDGTGGNPAGKVIAPAAGNANKLATAGDIANAINNSGFNITAGGNTVGNTPVATTAKPGSTLTLKAGDGLTVKQDLDANGDQSYTYALNAQSVVQSAQTPVVYTKADGSKVYKHSDGNFYDKPEGQPGAQQVQPGDVIASMQNAAGNTTAPTTLANVKGNLADTATAATNPANNDRTTLTANGKGNNAATVNDVLNAGFTVQGNGVNKDFVTHGDTINFADGQGTVAKVTSAGGVTKVQFDTPMTYVDPAGAATSTPSNKVKLVGGNAGAPVTLDNVADGTVAANSKEAVNGGQLHDLKENGFKIAADNGTPDTVKLTETVKYAGDSNIVTTVTDNQIGFKLANSITVGPATGGHPVTIDGNAGTVTGLTNKTWTPGSITSGRAATEDQLKAAQAAASNKVTAGDGITVTDIANTDGSTTYKVAADTTPLAVGDGTGGNPAGKVIAPAAGNANKLATAGDIANAINNSGFNITAGGNTVGNTPVATTAKPGSTLTLKAGDGLTVKQDLDANGDQSYTYALNAQSVVQSAQTPVVYTKADGSKVYKHSDGNFYDKPEGQPGAQQVQPGDVIASMQNAAGNTTAPTTLANVKGNLADTATAATNPANNDRTTLTANGKGNNAATVNDVLNAGFTVQGNGVNKDFVTHGDTINFADGQGTVAKVTSAGGVTKVQFDTPMTYVDPAGAATSTPSNKVKLVGGNAGAPVTLDNVADGTVAANSKEAVNGGQLHDLKENGFKIAADNGTPDTVKLTETVKYAGDSNIVTTVTDNQIGFKLANSITVGPATGGHPVTIDGNAGTVTGLTNKTWTPGSITSGRAATEDQLKAAVDDVSTVANKGWDIGNGAPAAVGTVKPGKKVDFVAGNGSTKVDVTQDATSGNSKVTVSAAPGALQYTSTNHAAGTNTPNADQFTPANQVTLVGPVGSTTGVTINNVAPAELSATSKQAVNGSQLYNTGSSTAAALGGTSSFDASTGKVTAGLNVGGTTHTSVQDALNAINTAAGAGWNLKANGGTASNIAPNGTVDVVNGSNTKVTLTGNTLKVDVVDNPTFSGPVTANGGLTVGGNLTVAPGANVNMGNNVIHNVADGVADTDAVNVRQLNAISGGINNVTKLVGENFTNPDGTKALDVYDVAKQTMTEHTSVISALNQVKREGTKYSHTRDNGEAPIIGPTNDSSAGALGSTAQGVNAIVEPDAVNATAMGHRARVRNAAAHSVAIGNEAVTGGASAVAIGDGAQALGKKSISIGTGNVVRGENSGAIGDPTIINAANSYSVGNNNTIAAGSHDAFVLGNNVTATAANSVHLGSGAAAQTAATPQTAGMTTYNVGIVNGVAYNYAGGTPTGVVTVGDVGQERRIQNVAAGQVSPTSTDAINGSQLYQTTMAINNGISTTINNLSNKIDANHNKAMGGVASAMASAGLPQAYVPGKSMVAMGAATYQGRTALALGVSTISDNGRWVLKGSVNTHNHGTVGANVGMGYQW